MEENKNIQSPYMEEEYDEIDIMELLRKLFKDWKLILKWCGIAAVAGLVIAFSIPKEYTVVSTLAPEIPTKSNSSSLSSLAGLAGINLNSMVSTEAVYPDLYPEIVSSAPFVVDLFPLPVTFDYKKEKLSSDLYGYLKDYTHGPWWGAVINFPFKVLGWVMGLFREKQEEVEGYASVNPAELTQEQEKIAKAIRESISLTIDKKTYMVTCTVTAQDPHVAAELSREVIERLQTYVIDYRTGKSRKDVEYYQQLFDEAQADYFDAQSRYARYVDSNQGVVLQRVRTEQERLQNEMNLKYRLYDNCAQQLQSAKAKVQLETPVFAVVNPPQVPLKRSKPSKVKILLASIFLGGMAAAVWILWGRDFFANLKKKDEEEEAPAKA